MFLASPFGLLVDDDPIVEHRILVGQVRSEHQERRPEYLRSQGAWLEGCSCVGMCLASSTTRRRRAGSWKMAQGRPLKARIAPGLASQATAEGRPDRA